MSEHREYVQLVRRLLRARSAKELDDAALLATSADAAVIARQLAPLWDAPGLDITEFRVNGVRGDVRLRSDDGHAWLLVLWVDGDRSPTVVGMTTYERPRDFRRDQAGCVVVLNGPSSVGKSSLMAAFADKASTPWACIDEPMFGRFAGKFLAWPDTAGPATDGFLAALAAAARLGNQFVVSSGGIAQDPFKKALGEVPAFYVGLHAPLAVLLERQVTQADKFGGLAEESVGIHTGWAYDLTIDTSSCTASEGAARITEFLTVAIGDRP